MANKNKAPKLDPHDPDRPKIPAELKDMSKPIRRNTSVASTSDAIEAIKKCRGLYYLAAASLNMGYSDFVDMVNEDPYLESLAKDERGKTLDIAEAKLMEAVGKGEQWAINLILKTLGRDRGFVERQEISNTTQVKLQIVEEIVDCSSSSISLSVSGYNPSGLPEAFTDGTTTKEP